MKNLLKKSMVVGCLLLCNVIMASSSGRMAPRISQYPDPKEKSEGEDVVWNLSAVGTPTPTFFTYFKDVEINRSERHRMFSLGNDYSLTITNLSMSDAGQYKFLFRNIVGETSTSVPLTMTYF